MAQQLIGLGTTPNDGTGDTLRTAGQKINANFSDLYAGASVPIISSQQITAVTEIYTSKPLVLVNGLNSNLVLIGSLSLISGPTAAFSIGGFVAPSTDGNIAKIFNPLNQTMTIVNGDASSSANNRINTLSGANVVLRANLPSFATFHYDLASHLWILEGFN